MKYLVILSFLCFFTMNATAGVELLVGAGIGKVKFQRDTPTTDKFAGDSLQIQGTARGTLTTGNFQIGAGVTRASGKMDLAADEVNDSSAEYKHLYYGPVFGYIINKSFRIDLEYYTDSTIEITKTDENSSDLFAADDKIFGSGFGLGVSLLRGHFITQILYQSFSAKRVELGEVEYDAASDEVNNINIQNLSLQIGLLF